MSSSSARGWARGALTTLSWAVKGAAVALLVAVAVSYALGMRPVVILSGSMRPAIDPGDILVERRVPPDQVRVGDVVTFREPGTEKRLITHRVRSVEPGSGGMVIATKGDMNASTERFTVPEEGTVGRPEWRIPLLGYVTTFAHTPAGLILAVFGPLLALGFLELRDIWGFRSPRLALSHHLRRTTHGAGA